MGHPCWDLLGLSMSCRMTKQVCTTFLYICLWNLLSYFIKHKHTIGPGTLGVPYIIVYWLFSNCWSDLNLLKKVNDNFVVYEALPEWLCSIFLAEMDPKERLAHQRKLLQKKLGLNIGAAMGMDTEELFNDEDLDDTSQSSGFKAHGSKALAGFGSHNHVVCMLWNILYCKRQKSITTVSGSS